MDDPLSLHMIVSHSVKLIVGHAETENGDFNAIVQFYSLHHFLLLFLWLMVSLWGK